MSQVTVLRELALNRAIDDQLDGIVRGAGSLAILLKGSDMGKSQLRNALNASLQTGSVEVVNNFIRYQISREKGWRENGFGEQVIAALGHGQVVHKGAMSAAKSATEHLEHAVKEGRLAQDELPSVEYLAQVAYVRLTRLFLGYLNRWYLVGKEGHWQDVASIVPEFKLEKEASA